MARLKRLLYYARVSNRRSMAIRYSGEEKLLELCVGVAAAIVLFRQLRMILTGPLPARISAAHLLLLVLAFAWAVVPSSVNPQISLRALALYPLTSFQKAVYCVLSYVQDWRIVVILGASLLTVFALVGVPQPLIAITRATALLAIAASLGLGIAIALSTLQYGLRSHKLSPTDPKKRRYPLLAENVRYYARTMDPYLAFLFSALAGLTEYLGSWITPAKVTIPLLILATLQLVAVLNPFGLEKPSEMERYRLLPAPYWKLLVQKHIALTAFFLASAFPLVATLAFRMSWPELCACGVQLSLVLMSWLLTGLILMRTASARHLRMSIGTISGGNLSMLFAVLAAALLTVLPAAETLAVRGASPSTVIFVGSGLLPVLVAAYYLLVRRQRWPVETSY